MVLSSKKELCKSDPVRRVYGCRVSGTVAAERHKGDLAISGRVIKSASNYSQVTTTKARPASTVLRDTRPDAGVTARQQKPRTEEREEPRMERLIYIYMREGQTENQEGSSYFRSSRADASGRTCCCRCCRSTSSAFWPPPTTTWSSVPFS